MGTGCQSRDEQRYDVQFPERGWQAEQVTIS